MTESEPFEPLQYSGAVFRPPSEARSLIVQVTLGCSWNKCTFCQMYQEKKFTVTPEARVFDFIDRAARQNGRGVRRVFLGDGDALCLKTDKLLRILTKLQDSFPALERVSTYAYEPNVRRKSDEELRSLVDAKLTLGYLGLESGDEDVLSRIRKGCSGEQMATAIQRMRAQGMTTSVMVLLGMGGVERSREHARNSAIVLNQMQPDYVGFLTVTPVEGTEFFEEIKAKKVEEISPMRSLEELRWITEDLDLTDSVFRSNHASNYLPIGGTLPQDKEDILATIDLALDGQISLKSESFRGL